MRIRVDIFFYMDRRSVILITESKQRRYDCKYDSKEDSIPKPSHFKSF